MDLSSWRSKDQRKNHLPVTNVAVGCGTAPSSPSVSASFLLRLLFLLLFDSPDSLLNVSKLQSRTQSSLGATPSCRSRIELVHWCFSLPHRADSCRFASIVCAQHESSRLWKRAGLSFQRHPFRPWGGPLFPCSQAIVHVAALSFSPFSTPYTYLPFSPLSTPSTRSRPAAAAASTGRRCSLSGNP